LTSLRNPAEIQLPMILLTPEFCIQAGYTLGAYCSTCRTLRDVDLLALAASGREKVAIGEMKFRCSQCGNLGQPHVMGWEAGERRTWS
jgi:hypothetical protein